MSKSQIRGVAFKIWEEGSNARYCTFSYRWGSKCKVNARRIIEDSIFLFMTSVSLGDL